MPYILVTAASPWRGVPARLLGLTLLRLLRLLSLWLLHLTLPVATAVTVVLVFDDLTGAAIHIAVAVIVAAVVILPRLLSATIPIAVILVLVLVLVLLLLTATVVVRPRRVAIAPTLSVASEARVITVDVLITLDFVRERAWLVITFLFDRDSDKGDAVDLFGLLDFHPVADVTKCRKSRISNVNCGLAVVNNVETIKQLAFIKLTALNCHFKFDVLTAAIFRWLHR